MKKERTAKLDTRHQTLTHQGRKYRYEIHDARDWASEVNAGDHLHVPAPKITWTANNRTDPIQDPLASDLTDAYMNATMYEGLRSQAKCLLERYGHKTKNASRQASTMPTGCH